MFIYDNSKCPYQSTYKYFFVIIETSSAKGSFKIKYIEGNSTNHLVLVNGFANQF